MPQVRIYGTAREGHRENWKGKYHVIRRDKKGRFISHRKWTQKQPIQKIDLRKDGKLVPATKEAVAKEIRKWEWKKRPKVKS